MDMSNKPWRDEFTMRRLYLEEGKSFSDIANELNISESTVGRWLSKHDIETRKSNVEKSNADTSKLRDPEYLERMYFEKDLHLHEVADKIGCTKENVRYWLKKHGLGLKGKSVGKSDGEIHKLHDEKWLRTVYCQEEKSSNEIAAMLDVSDTAVREWMERHGISRRSKSENMTDGDIERLHDPVWLEEKYWGEEWTTNEIAEELGVWQQTISKVMERYGIERRGHDECHPSGKDHPNYKGGVPSNGKYYGPNWIEQRQQARIRDQARCQRCRMNESDHYEKYDQALHVHHITNRREFIDSDGVLDYESANDLNNLITLCFYCHRQVENWGVEIDRR